MPSPVGLVVKNGWNSLSLISGGMPVPLSRTVTSISSSVDIGRNAQCWAVRGISIAHGPLVDGVKAVAEQVEKYPGHLLGDQLDGRSAGSKSRSSVMLKLASCARAP